MSIFERRIEDTPIAVVDFETTGFSPRNGSRVIEVAVARVEPRQPPRLVLDTLVDPGGPVYAKRVHGITEDDTLGAPTFADLSGTIAEAVEGAVVATFNASFDMSFWRAEFERLPERYQVDPPPYVCMMYMRPVLYGGRRCNLDALCAEHGLPAGRHRAADDALATAYLWLAYRRQARSIGCETFGDLTQRQAYAFMESFHAPPLSAAAARHPWRRPSPTALKPRFEPSRFAHPQWPWPTETAQNQTQSVTVDGLQITGELEQVAFSKTAIGRRVYWQGLVNALTDGWINDEEIALLAGVRERYELQADDIRALHGRIFAERLLEMAKDELLTVDESRNVAHLHDALRTLGWAPGSPPGLTSA